MTDPQDEADPWLTLSEAASKTGRHIDAVRSLVRRRRLSVRKGNNGQWLVQLPQSDLVADAAMTQAGLAKDAGSGTPVTELLAEVTELREALAGAKAQAKAAHDIADARVTAARAEATAVRELADRLTAELVEARRPWWRRWV
jgi:hypothetical protein